MKKAFRIIKITVRTLVLVLVALLLAYNIYTLVMRYACGVGIPTVFGYGCAVVETGSMEPAIGAGDFIIVHAEEEYAVGDVITFYDSTRGEYVTHRIILVTESGYTTKGDANNAQDNFNRTAERGRGQGGRRHERARFVHRFFSRRPPACSC